MALTVYNEAKYLVSIGELNLSSDTLKVMLVTQGYIVDPNHTYADDGTLVSPAQYEVAGTGYIGGWNQTGRREILNKLVVRDPITSRIRLFGDYLIWNPINVGVVGGLIIVREGESSDDDTLLLGYTNEGGFPFPTDGGEIQVRWNTNGIIAF